MASQELGLEWRKWIWGSVDASMIYSGLDLQDSVMERVYRVKEREVERYQE